MNDGKRPQDSERQIIIAELLALETHAPGQAIAVASIIGSAGCRVLVDTLQNFGTPETPREYPGPKSK